MASAAFSLRHWHNARIRLAKSSPVLHPDSQIDTAIKPWFDGGMMGFRLAIWGIAGFALGNFTTNGNTKGLNLGWAIGPGIIVAIAIAVLFAVIFGVLMAMFTGAASGRRRGAARKRR